MESAANGVQKFLELMNLLNKNPDKCKKWLQNQDLMKKKLGEKYNEPVIYSTVKLISEGQAESSNVSIDGQIPKVTNSLELLNVLYLNPDKCKKWLEKQVELKKKEGEKYEEPTIFSTVKLIALRQSKSAENKSKKDITNSQKESEKIVENKSLNTSYIERELYEDKKNIETPVGSKKIKVDETITSVSVSLDNITEIKESVTENKTNQENSNVQSGENEQNISKITTLESNIVNKKSDTGSVVYVLFPPHIRYRDVLPIIEKQKALRQKQRVWFRVPKFNFKGKKLQYYCNRKDPTLNRKHIFYIPLEQNESKIIECPIEVLGKDPLNWIEDIVMKLPLFEKLDFERQQSKRARFIQHVPFQNLAKPLITNSGFPPSPYDPSGQNMCYAINDPINIGQDQNLYTPPSSVQQQFSSISQQQYYFDAGFHQQQNHAPQNCTNVSQFSMDCYSQSNFGLHSTPPTSTDTKVIHPLNSTHIPKPSTENPQIENVKSNVKDKNISNVTTEIPLKSNLLESNVTKPYAIMTDKRKTEDFSTENCKDNIAFRYKGREVFYPYYVKDFYSRKKWVDNQRRICFVKGESYCPPKFDSNGKLIRQKFEIENKTTISPTKQSDEIVDMTVLSVAEKAVKAFVQSTNTPVFDKFGMRVNSEAYQQHKEGEDKNKKYDKNIKSKVCLSDVFTKTAKIQPPPEKSKIAVKLKKDDKPKKKKEKELIVQKQINCQSIRVAHQNMQNENSKPFINPSAPVQYPGLQTNKLQPPSMVPKVTTGWPLSIIKEHADAEKLRSVTPTMDEERRSFTPPARGLGKSKPSAFERLGPPTEAKKPKLTVNVTSDSNSEKTTRKVVEEHVPVYLRKDIMTSKDAIVREYLDIWPWSKPVKILKECSYRSEDIFMDEIEMMPHYGSKSVWIKVEATGYPPHFKKEDVLDILLNFVGTYREFIPCFIEFKPEKCTFLLNRSEQALIYLHHNGLVVKKNGVEIKLTLSVTNLTLDSLKFYKGGIFKTKLQDLYDEEFKSLNLSYFQLQPDNSHFLYFPLNFSPNQTLILNVVKAVLPSRNITMLDLSGNRLTNVSSLNLSEYFPSLRILDLSKNLLPTVSTLVCFKGVPMYSLSLEGNPLCINFIQKEHYTQVVKLIFPTLLVLDGVKVDSKVDVKKNFSVSRNAVKLVNTFLEIFFTLTDSNDRLLMESLYCDKSVFSITCRPEMKKNVTYHNLREFYMWCRILNDSINHADPLEGTIVGAKKIARYFNKWPVTMHDPFTFTVDVILHTETTTVLKVTGLFKIPAESLNQDEPVTEFSRNFVLCTEDGVEYKILNDMMYISEATKERVSKSFQIVAMNKRITSMDATCLRFDTPPDDNMKEKLAEILSELSGLKNSSAIKCLEKVEWNLKKALEYFIRLEKVDAVGSLDLV